MLKEMSHGDLVVWNDKVGIIINRENTCQIYVPKEKKVLCSF